VIKYGQYGRNLWKWDGNYERKVSWIVKWFEKYGSWRVKWYWKHGRKFWKDMENMEENCEIWNDKENMKERRYE
jgi:hypothetical protein